MLTRVVFLDRDGVINRDSPDYIKSLREIEFLPGSLEGIRLLTEAGFSVIVATNQSMIGRNIASLEDLDRIHRKIQAAVSEAGGRILDIFFCPHRPDAGCPCRKPEPGLILQAQKRHGIHLASAFLVGDSVRDIECGRRAGCGGTVLVRTGNGAEAEAELERTGMLPDYVADDLHHAALWIVSHPTGLASEP